MGSPVVAAAVTQCSFGAAPSVLNVLPMNRVMVEGRPAANIMDNKPFVNVVPFGLCTSLANPATAGLTAAALGVLTPGPCIPAITAPWMPGASKTMIANFPALTDNSQCMCSFGGVVQVKVAGSVQTQVN